MVRIMVADDHAVVREGLKQIINAADGLTVAAEAANGDEALGKVRTEDFDVLVLDISMPGPSGLDILKEVRAVRPALPVLILSIHPEEQFAVRLLKSGASGYLTKESAPDELVNAIRKVVDGGKYVSPALAEQLAFDLESGADKPLHELLSDREFQVLRMLAAGLTVKSIAEQLALSVKTVSTYRTRLLEKMNLKSNAELIHYAIKNDLLD